LRWSANITLPGFHGVSLNEVSGFFFRELFNSNINERAKAVTFSFIMSIPPTLLFLFTLVPYLPLENFKEVIFNTLFLILPNERTFEATKNIIQDFMDKQQTGILTFSILLTFFFSSNGMMGLMNSFDRSLPFIVKRSGLKTRWMAIKLTLLVIMTALLCMAALILQSEALNFYLLLIFNEVDLPRFVSIFIISLMVFFTISMVYRYGPSFEQKVKLISAGSVTATFLIILLTAVFFFLVNNFLNYNKIYGPIGSLIAMMIWMFMISMVLLIGYELNVSIYLGKHKLIDTLKKDYD